MSIFEYNQEAHMECVRGEGYEDGLITGREEGMLAGIKQGALQQLTSLVQDGVLTCEQAALRLGISTEEFEKQLKACIQSS